MNKTLLLVGIIVTGISLLAITVFSISNFILKRIYKDEEKQKTKTEKTKEKTVKRVLSATKRLIKSINKKLLENYLAFYGITALTFTGGAVMTTVSAVKMAVDVNESSSSLIVSSDSLFTSSIVESSSENTSLFESSETSSSESISSSEHSSSELVSSSEVISSSEEISSEEMASEPTDPIYYAVTFYIPASTEGTDEIEYEEGEASVEEGQTVSKPTNPDSMGNGYCFVEWCTDTVNWTPYDFDQPVTSNLELHAKYEYMAEITFVVVKGPYITDILDYQYVQIGSCVVPIDDYTWYTSYDVEDNEVVLDGIYDFNITVSEYYMTLYRLEEQF